MDRDETVPLLELTSELCGRLALASVDEGVAAEFGAHRDSYDAIAQMLGNTSDTVGAPTDTAAKAGSMIGGKQ